MYYFFDGIRHFYVALRDDRMMIVVEIFVSNLLEDNQNL